MGDRDGEHPTGPAFAETPDGTTVTEAASSTDGNENESSPGGADATARDGRKRSGKRALTVAAGLCAAAFIAAVVMAVLLTVTVLQKDSAADAAASDRNAAAEAAGDAAIALTTVSMDDIDGSLEGMYEVTTGELAQQFAPGSARDDLAAALKETGVSMTTDLNSAVLTSFSEEKDTASALAFVVRTQTMGEGETRVLRQGINLNLVKTDGEWKVQDFDTRFAGVGDAGGDNTGADGVPAQPAPGGGGDEAPGNAQPGAGAATGGGPAPSPAPAPAPGQQNPAGS